MNTDMPKVRKSFYTVVVKRFLDIVLSAVALVVLSPLLLVLSILEVVYQGLPVFYNQIRPGLNEELFTIHKFRSMTNDTDENGDPLPNDMRLTPFGRVIRRFSLDELPELWCILIGKMSIIGPRPLVPEYLPYYSPRHHMRHAVRPGLACVSLKPMKTWTWNDQFENDMWYIENCSFMVDLKMLFRIARSAIVGSEYRTSGDRQSFAEYNPAFIPKKDRNAQKREAKA